MKDIGKARCLRTFSYPWPHPQSVAMRCDRVKGHPGLCSCRCVMSEREASAAQAGGDD